MPESGESQRFVCLIDTEIFFRQRSHCLREREKHGFISTVRPTVHTNQAPKRSFSKTLFKSAEFKNVGVFVWTENILERSFSKTMTSRWSRDFPDRVVFKHKFKMVGDCCVLNSTSVVWTEIILSFLSETSVFKFGTWPYSCIPALLHVTYRVITRFRRFSCPCFPALSTCCMLSYLCLVGYNVLFSGIVFASESLHKGKSPVCFIFYWFDWIFIGAVTNSQIIPKPLYLDNPPPKSSLPPIQPFKRHVHVPNQSREKQVSGHSGTADGESNSDSIRLVLKGKLSEV